MAAASPGRRRAPHTLASSTPWRPSTRRHRALRALSPRAVLQRLSCASPPAPPAPPAPFCPPAPARQAYPTTAARSRPLRRAPSHRAPESPFNPPTSPPPLSLPFESGMDTERADVWVLSDGRGGDSWLDEMRPASSSLGSPFSTPAPALLPTLLPVKSGMDTERAGLQEAAARRLGGPGSAVSRPASFFGVVG